MLEFKAKMHKIRFPLGLCPRPRWGSLQRSPNLPAVFKGPTSKGRDGKMGKGRRGREGARPRTTRGFMCCERGLSYRPTGGRASACTRRDPGTDRTRSAPAATSHLSAAELSWRAVRRLYCHTDPAIDTCHSHTHTHTQLNQLHWCPDFCPPPE